jgi:hypothetical protein
MIRTTLAKFALLPLLISTFCPTVFEQAIAQPNDSSAASLPYDEVDAADAPDIIFTNLDRTPGDKFNSNTALAFIVAGDQSITDTETWQAIRFVPSQDVQAKVLKAAIGWQSGTRSINLGIFADNGNGTVGEPLPGGQGIPPACPILASAAS